MSQLALITAPNDGLADIPLPALFKALGDDLRTQLLRVMSGDSFSVSELCDIFGIRQSALSHHLKILVQADLLARKREGTALFYRRQIPKGCYRTLRLAALSDIDAQPLPDKLAQGMRAVQKQREENSSAFFRDHAAQLREQQELIAPWEDYSAASIELLDNLNWPTLSSVLEIGPGDGAFLPALAQRARHVIALDNAPSMLAQAKRCAGHLRHIQFVEGNTCDALTLKLSAQLVVANMVLHHTPDPRQVMAEAAALIQPGGALLISELCAHDQAWAREHCGDLWLGFDPDTLSSWAREAGLADGANVFLGQRNGFQVQVRLFHKTVTSEGLSA